MYTYLIFSEKTDGFFSLGMKNFIKETSHAAWGGVEDHESSDSEIDVICLSDEACSLLCLAFGRISMKERRFHKDLEAVVFWSSCLRPIR